MTSQRPYRKAVRRATKRFQGSRCILVLNFGAFQLQAPFLSRCKGRGHVCRGHRA
jgi:hypothetical protein